MADSLQRNSEWPAKKDDHCGADSLQTALSDGLTMGSASSSSRFLGANMAKGMSKLVRVTWRRRRKY